MTRLLTVAEVAEILKVSTRSVTRWFSDYPGVVRMSARAMRIPEDVLESWVQAKQGISLPKKVNRGVKPSLLRAYERSVVSLGSGY